VALVDRRGSHAADGGPPALAPAVDRQREPLPRGAVPRPLAVAHADGGEAVRGPGVNGAGAADGLPAQLLAMGMSVGLFGRVAREHVIDELEQAVEALWC
jgi:hypothetical protein